MTRLDMADYNPAARRFWLFTALLGAGAFLYSLAHAWQMPTATLVQIAVCAAAAAFVALFPVRIPGTKTSVSGGEIFIFLALLLHGMHAAVLVAALEGAVASWRTSRRWTSRIGTPAILSLSMLIAAAAFEAMRAQIAISALGNVALLAASMSFGLIYFGLVSGITSTVFALKAGSPITPLRWWLGMAWLGSAYMTSAVVAGLLFISFQRFGLAVLLVAGPMIAMFLCTLHSVFARREAIEKHMAELYHNAYHDGLTQLANRQRFNEQLGRALARQRRSPEHAFAVMYLDFDRFKLVNDSLGHNAGDKLLVDLGKRLLASLRPTDLVARLGGDEFAILLEDVQHERDVVELTERVQRQLQRPFVLDGIEITISASIGITHSRFGYESADQIVRDADIAMYKAKSLGKARYAIFEPSQHREVTGQLLLESELRRAIAQNQLFLVYQPIYALRENALSGFEALVRWRHPEHGAMPPAAFIPIAEETGLIVPLGNWVLEEACRQLAAWLRDGAHPGLRISVNISSLQLRNPDFVAHVQRVLAETGLAPNQLTLEVTETVLMHGIENAAEGLERLRALGVMLSIDDFGTGYSSLNYLATLPIDDLKLDRSFIEQLCRGGNGAEIVKAVFRLGQALGKRVFAEGIETAEQLSTLQSMGCDYGQGFMLARPMECEAADRLLATTPRVAIPRTTAMADVPEKRTLH